VDTESERALSLPCSQKNVRRATSVRAFCAGTLSQLHARPPGFLDQIPAMQTLSKTNRSRKCSQCRGSYKESSYHEEMASPAHASKLGLVYSVITTGLIGLILAFLDSRIYAALRITIGLV
jgi:hypothetical protein